MRSMKRSRAAAISFFPRTKVFYVISLDDMTDDEIERCWTTEEEQAKSQRDVVRNVEVLRSNPKSMTEENGFCERGIEHLRDSQTMKARKTIKLSVIDAVMDEQEAQWDSGKDDMERIRRASIEISKASAAKALTLASLDAKYVQDTSRLEKGENPDTSREIAQDNKKFNTSKFTCRASPAISIDEMLDRATSRLASTGLRTTKVNNRALETRSHQYNSPVMA